MDWKKPFGSWLLGGAGIVADVVGIIELATGIIAVRPIVTGALMGGGSVLFLLFLVAREEQIRSLWRAWWRAWLLFLEYVPVERFEVEMSETEGERPWALGRTEMLQVGDAITVEVDELSGSRVLVSLKIPRGYALIFSDPRINDKVLRTEEEDKIDYGITMGPFARPPRFEAKLTRVAGRRR